MGLLPKTENPDLLVGANTGDDAAVWRMPDDNLLISTADFFGPLVDDAFLWGQIATTNAVSDIYAMGGAPLFGLNLVCWPTDTLGLDVLSEVLAGGAQVAQLGGWQIAGGHTITGSEPLYGQAVTGKATSEQLLTLSGAEPGDKLVLTKPLGTGIITTAAMRRPPSAAQPGGELHNELQGATVEMLRLNDVASRMAHKYKANAATDITGFGLLGHLTKLCQASGVTAELDTQAVPTLAGAKELAAAGFVPGGTGRNLEFIRPALNSLVFLDFSEPDLDSLKSDNPDPSAIWLSILADPQTSGGLLISFPAQTADEAVAELIAQNHHAAVVATLRSMD